MASREKNHRVDAGFPQWNSKLSFSAQKPHAAAQNHKNKKEPARETPLGQPRRVPAAAGREARVQNATATLAKGVSTCSDATRQTPSDSDKTPTICLFQRFESLTISTPAAATAGKSVTASAGGPANDNDKSRPRHSVAFGTPSVLTYTPAAVPAAAQASPLWSNAGHTPYSLSDASATGRVTECDDGNSHSSSGVCMELFSSVITDTGAEQTPAGSNIPRTPLLGLAATATPAVSDTPAAALTATAAGVTPRSTGLPSSPDAAEADDMDLQTPVIRHLQTTQQPNAANGCSFTGFNTVQDCLDTGHPKDGTPVFFSKGKAQLAAEDGTSTSVNTAQGATPAGAISSLSMPTLTPKSRLKQPARVQLHTSRPAVPSELKQLLGDRAEDKTTAIASTNKSLLGSCGMLSPVRSKKQQQQSLGAEQQVLTPVRRSARKSSKQLLATDNEHVKPMLEATNYCYQPNDALRDLQHHC